VTGLLDGYQDKKHKLSMYSIAKNIGLPATFVELRHQCTHEELPSLAKLRAVAERSLSWIWDHYWKNLVESATPADIDQRRAVLREYLQWRADRQSQEQDQEEDFALRLRRWNKEQLLEVLMELIDQSTTEPSLLRQALRLSRAILSGEEDPFALESLANVPEKETRSLEDIRADIARAEAILQRDEGEEEDLRTPEIDEQDEHMEGDDGNDEGTGWEMWKGPWVPKPIGVV
jgi:ribosomal biogenesis protein LAS1